MNRSAPFHGQMLYKPTKPGSVCPASDWSERLVSEMTYNMLLVMLNPTCSLAQSLSFFFQLVFPELPTLLIEAIRWFLHLSWSSTSSLIKLTLLIVCFTNIFLGFLFTVLFCCLWLLAAKLITLFVFCLYYSFASVSCG